MQFVQYWKHFLLNVDHWMEGFNRNNVENWEALFRLERRSGGEYLSLCVHAGICAYISVSAFLNVRLTESGRVSHHWQQAKIERWSVPRIAIFFHFLNFFLSFTKKNESSWCDGGEKSMERVNFFLRGWLGNSCLKFFFCYASAETFQNAVCKIHVANDNLVSWLK